MPAATLTVFLTVLRGVEGGGVVCFSDAQDTALPPLRHSGLEGH